MALLYVTKPLVVKIIDQKVSSCNSYAVVANRYCPFKSKRIERMLYGPLAFNYLLIGRISHLLSKLKFVTMCITNLGDHARRMAKMRMKSNRFLF